ncbi:MAG: phosphoribosyl-ATP diphosphatase [Candidatus Protistobacter heckmanni]|nr:phosphoribosyl-ATP diphosphatase [Candidatus Protistobacter heckmanni]
MSDILNQIGEVVESRAPAKGGDPETSYVAHLMTKGDDAILKKIGEEASETIMAAKDARAAGLSVDAQKKLVAETADLWFHSLVMLAHFGLKPADVLAELARREGLSGLDEFAARRMQASEKNGG